MLLCSLLLLIVPANGQENPLDKVHVDPPQPKAVAPQGPPPAEGKAALTARPNERIRVDVNLVLIR